jgi:hypothetical protein
MICKNYRGFRIEVKREGTYHDKKAIFSYIERITDGCLFGGEPEYTDETVKEVMERNKHEIDLCYDEMMRDES